MPAMVGGQGGGAVLDGVLERVTFANPETGYTIARIVPERGGAELVTAVGPLLGAQVGEFLRLRGRWSSHPKYGRQFEVHSYATVLPATAAGIQKYLGSGLIKGIGPVMAERMVAHFGVDIMHVIDDEPGRLTEVDGLGPKRTAMIAAAWAEQKAIKEVMIFLQSVGVSTSLAVRIYKKYGDASVSVVRSEPYRLAADVWGIGVKTADTIAAAGGIARDSPERIKAGLGRGGAGVCGGGAGAVPAGRGRVGHRVQDRGHDRRRGRHRPGQPGADQGGPSPHPVRSGRRRALLPARAQPDRRRREDPRRASRAGRPEPRRAGRGRRSGPRGGTRFGLARAGPGRADPGRAAGSRRLPAAFLSGRTIPGSSPAPPACHPG